MNKFIEEAILHAEEKGIECAGECGRDHRQLAEWLKELVTLRVEKTSCYSGDGNSECLTVGELKRLTRLLPNDVKVVYARIEDVYFDEHGWEPLTLKADEWWDRLSVRGVKDAVINEPIDDGTAHWIQAFEAFYNKEENVLKITAHY